MPKTTLLYFHLYAVHLFAQHIQNSHILPEYGYIESFCVLCYYPPVDRVSLKIKQYYENCNLVTCWFLIGNPVLCHNSTFITFHCTAGCNHCFQLKQEPCHWHSCGMNMQLFFCDFVEKIMSCVIQTIPCHPFSWQLP